ncbi:hypothetical protein evm_008679 [Chilo suppressalis]|nr:hypothetical protein evm_008679 [Chilo suppressalis]
MRIWILFFFLAVTTLQFVMSLHSPAQMMKDAEYRRNLYVKSTPTPICNGAPCDELPILGGDDKLHPVYEISTSRI